PVPAELPLSEAVERARAGAAAALVVVDVGGRAVGIVDEAGVAATPPHRRPWVAAGAVSRGLHDGLVLSADLGGDDLLAAMRRSPAREYVVVEPSGELYGVLATTDVERAVLGRAGS
ncbi:MAG: site-2 protease family protein, partial [Actinomycetota bacterium]|nr:site-2 protease family protein [Actinomycetota bacterium]